MELKLIDACRVARERWAWCYTDDGQAVRAMLPEPNIGATVVLRTHDVGGPGDPRPYYRAGLLLEVAGNGEIIVWGGSRGGRPPVECVNNAIEELGRKLADVSGRLAELAPLLEGTARPTAPVPAAREGLTVQRVAVAALEVIGATIAAVGLAAAAGAYLRILLQAAGWGWRVFGP